MWDTLETDALRTVGLYAWRVFGAIIILAVGIWLARIIKNTVSRMLVSRQIDPTIISFVDSAIKVVLYGLVIIEVLYKLGVESSTLVAVVGAAGLTVGLALRGHLSNVAAGLLVILFHPFGVGDEIEGGGSAGRVERIQLLTTEVRTPDNLTVIVPNSKLLSDKIVNYSRGDTRRVNMLLGVSYKTDIKKVRDVLKRIIDEDKLVLKDPEPNVTVQELGEKGVKIEIEVWVKSRDHSIAKAEMNEKIKERFDSEEIPFL